MRPPRRALLILLLAGISLLALAQVRDAGNAPNSPQQRSKPYVVMVSLDGFRHDYAELHGAPNLLALGRKGVRAKGLIPVYPSLTFPSHYSIATGIRPDKHGMLEMQFHDPPSGGTFFYADGKSAGQSRWYGGTPLWVLAEQQGMRTASYFWVGTEAEIQGRRPSYWAPYRGSVSHEARVQQVMDWLRLPEELRPHLVFLYFSDVDSAGHYYGPESTETREAVRAVDATLGVLADRLRTLPFAVNVIVVSDHGMEAVDGEYIEVDRLADVSGLLGTGLGPQVMYYSRDQQLLEKTYAALRGKDPRIAVYRRSEVPAHLHYSRNPRIGDLVVIPNGPYLLAPQPWQPTARQPRRPVFRGMHGYDPSAMPSMNGILFAAGPDLAAGVETGAVDSLDLYPLITRILGLKPPAGLDGDFKRVRHLYRSR